MDRAFVCSLQQLGSLFLREQAGKMNVSFDAIEHSFFGFAFRAIDGVNLRMPQLDGDFLERPTFAASIDRHGH